MINDGEVTAEEMEEARAVTSATIRFWSHKAADVLATHTVIRRYRITDIEIEALAMSLGFHVGKTLIEDSVGTA